MTILLTYSVFYFLSYWHRRSDTLIFVIASYRYFTLEFFSFLNFLKSFWSWSLIKFVCNFLLFSSIIFIKRNRFIWNSICWWNFFLYWRFDFKDYFFLKVFCLFLFIRRNYFVTWSLYFFFIIYRPSIFIIRNILTFVFLFFSIYFNFFLFDFDLHKGFIWFFLF